MNDEQFLVAPPRLKDGDDEIGRALRERQDLWDAAERRSQPNRAQFAALCAKHDRWSMVRTGFTFSAAAVVLLGLTSLGHFLVDLRDEPALTLAPDRMHVPPSSSLDPQHRSAPQSSVGAALPAFSQSAHVAVPAAQLSPDDTLPKSASDTALHSDTALLSSGGRRPARGATEPRIKTAWAAGQDRLLQASAPDVSARGAESLPNRAGQDCARLGYVEARACYTAKGEGSGISAELAYLERARLEQNQGRDPAAALRSLDEYRRRFPQGTLQPEATVARIRLLVSTHQNLDARTAIAEALPRMPQKAPQLRGVALDLAVAAGDCAEAAQLLKQIPAEVATSAWKAAHLGGCGRVDRPGP